MTIQASDKVIYKKKKYTLIDVEKGKQIINCAEFKMPEHAFFMSSGCLRGYTAEYIIEDEKLYGIKYETDWDEMKKIKSEKLFMNYTGSCIIALAENEEKKFYNSDFLECYLDYDIALELHFTNGILDEIINLADAINEMRELEKTEEYKSENTQPFTRKSLRKEIAYKHLKYEYDYRNYKWGRSIN